MCSYMAGSMPARAASSAGSPIPAATRSFASWFGATM